ncbi:hypothetical protein [Agathobaculum butyriciproducens]|uniref:hypothetical protein n=1 Tax=Agathobaculum butyriciproducens TaxID=1628085 RepID=UPI0036D3D2DD
MPKAVWLTFSVGCIRQATAVCKSCEIILLHEGADLVGMHGLKRIQQARGDALAADADAAQLMPDDAVRGQNARSAPTCS